MQDGTGTTTYAYDRLSRLTSAAQPNGTTSYGYDRDSNRTSVAYPGTGGGTVTYAFSSGGRLNALTDWSSRTNAPSALNYYDLSTLASAETATVVVNNPAPLTGAGEWRPTPRPHARHA